VHRSVRAPTNFADGYFTGDKGYYFPDLRGNDVKFTVIAAGFVFGITGFSNRKEVKKMKKNYKIQITNEDEPSPQYPNTPLPQITLPTHLFFPSSLFTPWPSEAKKKFLLTK
jgi:hypothetical protein